MVETTAISDSLLVKDTVRDLVDPEDAWGLQSHWDEIVGPEAHSNHSGKMAQEGQTCSHNHDFCPLLSTSWRDAPVVKNNNTQVQILLQGLGKGQSKNNLWVITAQENPYIIV